MDLLAFAMDVSIGTPYLEIPPPTLFLEPPTPQTCLVQSPTSNPSLVILKAKEDWENSPKITCETIEIQQLKSEKEEMEKKLLLEKEQALAELRETKAFLEMLRGMLILQTFWNITSPNVAIKVAWQQD